MRRACLLEKEGECELVCLLAAMNGGGGKLFLTLFALAVFEHFHGHETGSAGEDFVGELGFVVVVLDLRVLVTSFAWGECVSG